MTKETFINKYLGNPDYQYCEEHKDQMRDDLDKVIAYEIKMSGIPERVDKIVELIKKAINKPSHQ